MQVYGSGAGPTAVAPATHTAATSPGQGHGGGEEQPAAASPASPIKAVAPSQGQDTAEVGGRVGSTHQLPPASRGSVDGVCRGVEAELSGIGGARQGGAESDPRQSYGERMTLPQGISSPSQKMK